ncbi:MAG TPA: hypothetical protein VID24_01585 [Candidatus Eremiobacteraceae bacterium]
MSARRDALFLVLAAFTWLVVCATVAGCEQNEQQSSPSPLPSSVSAMLVAQAPVIGRTSFGPGVHVSIFNPSWLFSGARVVDETLYAMYYTKQSDDQRIAVVSRGVLHRVSFSRKYYALTFENDNRVIAAGMANEVKDWYLLQGDRAIAIPRPDSPVYGIPHHVLADGDSCSDGMAGSGSALDDLREHHRVSILTDAAMLRATNGALSKAVGVYCDHFHGKNYVTMDAPGVIFRLDGQEASLVSAGWVEAASDRHLLIETDDTFIEAEVP